jgi:hypothetical protein
MFGDGTSIGTGVVQSPNFPADYGNKDRYCAVTIVVPAGKKIRLEFTTFNLDSNYGSIDVSIALIPIDGYFIISMQSPLLLYFILALSHNLLLEFSGCRLRLALFVWCNRKFNSCSSHHNIQHRVPIFFGPCQ